MTTLPELSGLTALVTGGSRGLGEATARCLAEAGVRVMIGDVLEDAGHEVARSIREAGGEADFVRLDVTDASSVRDASLATAKRFGTVDVLVNNAGTDRTAAFDELTVDDWDRVMAVNLRGPFLVAHALFPEMKGRRTGHIINIVSTAARRAWANASAYHASKWGLLGLSHALHVEGREAGVKVTAIICGGMRTPFLLDRFPDIDPEVLQDPRTVAETIRYVLTQPRETVIPELMVLPMRETSWP